MIIKYVSIVLGYVLRLFARSVFKADCKQLSTKINCLKKQIKNRPSIHASLIELLVSGEDHRFYLHKGVDPIGISRAVFRRFYLRKIEGASTIHQQLVRVLTGQYERTYFRKFREICLASMIEILLPKIQIPQMYLEVSYFGHKMNGIRQACKRLNLNPYMLSMPEAAELIARLKYPESKNSFPIKKIKIKNRAAHLLALHKKHKHIGLHQTHSLELAY